jgi:inosine-uridine nucleoside N-ribohydrolase
MTATWNIRLIQPRMRVIIDNDFSGDPDGLVQLAHHLLSPSVEVRAIIGTHLREGDPWGQSADGDEVAAAVAAAEKIVSLCGKNGTVPVLAGAQTAMVDVHTPQRSAGIDFIIREAMREDVDTPLFVVCGASLTEIASAYLLEPRIAERLTVIWIGGHEHEGLAVPPPGAPDLEYNLHEDVVSGLVFFNHSSLPLWQIPRDQYRHVLASRAELKLRMAPHGELGAHLFNALGAVADSLNGSGYLAGEVYCLGDSPLVLLTALQSAFEADPASSRYVTMPCPNLLENGLYKANPNGRPIRVYTLLDNRMLLEDLYAKLEMHAHELD